MTRIVYVASFRHSFGTEEHIARDAERIPRVTVDRVQEPDRRADQARFLDALTERCDGADLLVYQKTYGLGPEAVNVWRAVEKHGTQTCSIHLDKYVGLARQEQLPVDAFWRTGTVFTADGDPISEWAYREHGIRHHWLPPACVSDECVPGTRRDGVEPIVFVGSRHGYHPEHTWRQTLIDGLEQHYGPQFGLYGARRPVRDQALNDLYASTTVAVGDSLILPGWSKYVSDRLTETLGRGGFLIQPRIDGIAERYGLRDGVHCRFYNFGDLDGLFRIIDHYVEHPDEAHAIAMAGQAHIRAHHTYTHRVREVLDTLGIVP